MGIGDLILRLTSGLFMTTSIRPPGKKTLGGFCPLIGQSCQEWNELSGGGKGVKYGPHSRVEENKVFHVGFLFPYMYREMIFISVRI